MVETPQFNEQELEQTGLNITIEKVISLALKTPGIKVNRELFLKNNFGNNPELKNKRPIDIFEEKILDKRAADVIRLHTTAATAASTIAGIPGGLAILPSAMADIVQYYSQTLILIQKLGYIYGWPDITNKEGDFDENTINELLIYLGVAMGVGAANKFIQELAEGAGKAAAKKIHQTAVTKTLWYPVLNKIMNSFNKKITKELAEQVAKKAVPALGAIISGALTLGSFSAASRRLKSKLKEEQQFSKSLEDHYVFSVLS